MDCCSNTVDFMGIRISEQLHFGRAYSSSAGCCCYCSFTQNYSGQTRDVGSIFLAIWSKMLIQRRETLCDHDAEREKKLANFLF